MKLEILKLKINNLLQPLKKYLDLMKLEMTLKMILI